jgi:hypothetical protein
MQHKNFIKRGGVTDSLAPIHIQFIHSGITHFRELKEESLDASKLRWDASSSEVKSREPFGYMNLFATTFRIERYYRFLQEEGPSWIECRYNPPIIWFPLESYQRYYQINKKKGGCCFWRTQKKQWFQKTW